MFAAAACTDDPNDRGASPCDCGFAPDPDPFAFGEVQDPDCDTELTVIDNDGCGNMFAGGWTYSKTMVSAWLADDTTSSPWHGNYQAYD